MFFRQSVKGRGASTKGRERSSHAGIRERASQANRIAGTKAPQQGAGQVCPGDSWDVTRLKCSEIENGS